MKTVCVILAAFLTLLIISAVFDAFTHKPPSCPLCDEQAVKCNVDRGRTLLRCENNHLWYQ